jgi:hypothetical protein
MISLLWLLQRPTLFLSDFFYLNIEMVYLDAGSML